MDTTAQAAAGTGASTAAAAPSPYSPPSVGAVPLGAGLVLACVAVAAVLLARRRGRPPRLVDIVETASLGPKRSLVVARMNGELLLLGASEGGIHLLAARPAPAAAGACDARQGHAAERAQSTAPESAVSGLLARLHPRTTAPRASFERLLTESAEDVELRHKLAASQAGSVR